MSVQSLLRHEPSATCASSAIPRLGELYGLATEAFANGNYATADLHAASFNQLLRKTDFSPTRRSTAEKPRHSIIVVSYRHSDDVLQQLQLLEDYTRDPSCELILANNGNTHLPHIVAQMNLDCTLLDPGLNLGASGGRNLGAHYARGENLIFLDDDGLIEKDAIEHLVACKERYGAVSVRGRIVPRTQGQKPPAHYDRGKLVVPSIPDTEGLALWCRRAYVRFGGFNVLLYGHEGLELFARMYRYYGPRSFLYTPHAVLHHDFHDTPEKLQAKTERYERNRKYLDFHDLKWRELIRTMRQSATSKESQLSLAPAQEFVGPAVVGSRTFAALPPISIITTAYNCEQFVEEYSTSLKTQTHQDFEVVFVDDGSTDATVERLRQAWPDDPRLRIIEIEKSGRGAALTRAHQECRNDICLIADMDDLSVPERLEWTSRYFFAHPESICLSFYCFNEVSFIRMPRPFPIAKQSIRCRSLIGMPVSFPAFAFRKSAFPKPFDPDLPAGVDCEWLFRNLEETEGDGDMVPLPAVYYRIHEQQITSAHRHVQRNQAIECVSKLHAHILGNIDDHDRKCIEILSGWTPIEHGRQLAEAYAYIVRLSDRLDHTTGTSPSRAKEHLYLTFLDLQERRMRHDYDAIRKRGSISVAANDQSAPAGVQTDYGMFGHRRLFIPFGLAAVVALGPKKDRQRFLENPAAFYESLPVDWQRRAGLFFFPCKQG